MSVIVTPDTVTTVEITDAESVVVVERERDVVEVVTAGAQGAVGEAGPGVPTGGDPGNVLLKSSYANYESEWSAVVDGGTFA
jgi:hypothetical protein